MSKRDADDHEASTMVAKLLAKQVGEKKIQALGTPRRRGNSSVEGMTVYHQALGSKSP